MINFARGHPNSDLLPIDPMKHLLSLAQERGDWKAYLNYPRNDNGNEEFVHQLQQFLGQETSDDSLGSFESISTDNNELFVTHGVSHAVDLLCAVLTEPGDIVGMEVPTYFLVGRIFENHGLELQSLPMKSEHHTLDVDRLEALLRDGEIKAPRMIYTIPTNHNPTASTLPVEDRIKLARLAETYDFYVIADEVYHLLDWRDADNDEEKRPARMACFNSSSGGRCLSVSSFTKIFCPGVRCGWVEGPSHVVQKLIAHGYIRSQGGCAPFVGELLRLGLEHGICKQVLDRLNSSYKERSDLLYNRMQASGNIRVAVKPTGGYFLWIQLPFSDTTKFASYCLGHGVKILPGASCDPFAGESMQSYSRLCFADLPIEELEDGATKLVRLVNDYSKNEETRSTT